MSFPIYVEAYSGYKANEHPRLSVLDDEIHEIAAVLDQWYEPSVTYLKVQSTESKTYVLRHDEVADEWTLQSGFDGDELLARPGIELVTVDPATALEAEQLIESCECCRSDDAEIPFDWILAEVTGKHACPSESSGFQIGGSGSKWAYTKATMSECAIPRNFETYLRIPNAAGRFDEALLKISPLIASIFTFEATRQLALVEAVG